MSIFRRGGGGDDPSPAPAAEFSFAPTPLTRARIEDWLRQYDYAYFVDSDGDAGGIWRGRVFYFLLLGDAGQVLQVRGQWNREANVEQLANLLEFCNFWNSDRIWPKTYARVRDDGSVVICADLTVDVEPGLTESQLDQTMRCALATTSAFFEQLDREFPDPLAMGTN